MARLKVTVRSPVSAVQHDGVARLKVIVRSPVSEVQHDGVAGLKADGMVTVGIRT